MTAASSDRALTFRAARPADIPAMSQIRLAVSENVLSDPLRITPQMYLDGLERLGHAWVCEIDGQVVGFAYAVPRGASIWALFVRPGYEGLGIGIGLLQRAVDRLFQNGSTELRLVTTINTRADRFYGAQGWSRGEMKNEVEVCFRLRKPGPSR